MDFCLQAYNMKQKHKCASTPELIDMPRRCRGSLRRISMWSSSWWISEVYQDKIAIERGFQYAAATQAKARDRKCPCVQELLTSGGVLWLLWKWLGGKNGFTKEMKVCGLDSSVMTLPCCCWKYYILFSYFIKNKKNDWPLVGAFYWGNLDTWLFKLL